MSYPKSWIAIDKVTSEVISTISDQSRKLRDWKNQYRDCQQLHVATSSARMVKGICLNQEAVLTA